MIGKGRFFPQWIIPISSYKPRERKGKLRGSLKKKQKNHRTYRNERLDENSEDQFAQSLEVEINEQKRAETSGDGHGYGQDHPCEPKIDAMVNEKARRREI